MPDPGQKLLIEPALVRLLAGLTGLHLDVVPAPSPGRAWDLRRLVAGCRAHARHPSDTRDSRCQTCARIQLRRALVARRPGHDFEGPCGVRSALLPVTGIAGPIGLLALRQGPDGAGRRAGSPATRNRRRDAVFRGALRLLRPLANQSTWRAGSSVPEIPGAAVQGASSRDGRHAGATSAPPGRDARSRRAVRALVERVRHAFAQPLELKRLARESGLNPSYLSTVFAREVGLPFKTYLTARRLEHAQARLRDPRVPIAQIAREAGYATPHRFRAVFREWTGVSPGRWRAAWLGEGEIRAIPEHGRES